MDDGKRVDGIGVMPEPIGVGNALSNSGLVWRGVIFSRDA